MNRLTMRSILNALTDGEIVVTDLVIVSMHEKSFPQADMYRDAAEIPSDEFAAMGIAPDDFMTFVRGSSTHDAMEAAKKRWPDAFIVSDDEDDDEGDAGASREDGGVSKAMTTIDHDEEARASVVMTDRERAIAALRRGVPLGEFVRCSCFTKPPTRNSCFGVCEDTVDAIVASYEALRNEVANARGNTDDHNDSSS